MQRLSIPDLPDLLALDSRCFELPWSERQIEEELSHPNAFVAGVRDCSVLVAAALCRRNVDEVEIFRIMVDPQHRRKGLAERLLYEIEKAARGLPLILEVNVNNTAALAFYEKNGFQMVGKRPAYYPTADGSRKDAVVMRKLANKA